jgi:hypothetical protein
MQVQVFIDLAFDETWCQAHACREQTVLLVMNRLSSALGLPACVHFHVPNKSSNNIQMVLKAHFLSSVTVADREFIYLTLCCVSKQNASRNLV